MLRAFKALITLIVVVVLGAAAFIGWYVFGAKVPPKPKLGAATHETGGPATPDGTWHVVPGEHTYVGYRIKELFGDAIVKRDAVGHTPAVHGTLTIAGTRVTAADVTADLSSLASDREARDAYVRDNSLETTKFPTARFALTKPIALPPRAEKNTELPLRATGRLLLHGVTRTVTLTLDARWNGPTIELVGSDPIKLADYRIKPPHTVIASVDDHGSLEFDLTFAPGAR